MPEKTPEQSAPAPKGDAAPKQPQQPDESLTLSRAELQKLIDDNRKEAETASERRLAEKAAKEQADREAAEAEKRGEFEKIANTEKGKREQAEARVRALENESRIRDAFEEVAATADGLTLKTLNEWVKPKVRNSIEPDATPEDVAKSAKRLAEQYAKDVAAAKPKGSAGAPARTGHHLAAPVQLRNNGRKVPPSISVAASRF